MKRKTGIMLGESQGRGLLEDLLGENSLNSSEYHSYLGPEQVIPLSTQSEY